MEAKRVQSLMLKIQMVNTISDRLCFIIIQRNRIPTNVAIVQYKQANKPKKV